MNCLEQRDSRGTESTRVRNRRITHRLVATGLLAAVAAGAIGCRETASRAQSASPDNQAANRSDAPDEPSPASPREVTFDDVKFEMTPEETFDRKMLTPKIEELLGKRIRIRGYMLPSFRQKGLQQFVLVRDNLECCFGPGAALYDCMLVTMQGDATADFSIPPITVEGTLRFEEFKDPVGGNHLAIYRLEGETVKR